MSNIDRRTLVKGSLAAMMAGAAGSRGAFAQSAEPILLGVSGPLTGPNAQYGTQWKQGFDLALEEIQAAGGINGRKLTYNFEDSQSDPRQSVAIAQKFVSDPRIVLELGDFSSPASMAASPIYQRAGLVQFGFTNSHPDFTKGGDFMWSTSVSQADEQPLLASYAVRRLGLKKLAVLHLNTDWGRTSRDYFVNAAKEYGAEIAVTEGYIAEERDFRSTLVRVRDANPDGLILISYYSDGALIARQARQVGLKQVICAASSVYSPKFLELGGEAVEEVHVGTRYFPEDPRPEVQKFIAGFKKKYNGLEPDAFNAYAYDAMNMAAAVVKIGGTDRRAIRDAFTKVKDVPSVIFGAATFDVATRRVKGAMNAELVVRKGQFALWDGKPT
ncbi:ABC transporter substrate-binding protein [Bradyrhizobium japonicum]|uniref:ABC transporter substrate-binding protein n=1 Tax=Bradyrhizobium japonicum TaxID=375 RepID=UPI000456A85F|nr:ABC transporter substrate-binding protein [Bradyrhizobium japonicum]AHY54034.1 ABC transporter substrate-binding protein substrate-binding protein [Bradyrhizobium japonicum SEMIA 5079]MCD9106757.1 ABC transporter substrate-binding protein [Bradyrhizobium japonicum]MCD9254096.1 ABC transporter substrate-binding protein [Bradyrhizobium japonicum SEMIA 5079]MCD9817965.1 ABC transporter substrate-binding protein [Bradyrhizobium japonicum]MCD9890987.1 ABC transporter substrate-binding protein [B